MKPNAWPELLPEADARDERTLEAVSSRPLFGTGPGTDARTPSCCEPGASQGIDSHPRLSDDLVRLEQDERGNREPKRLGGLEVDDQLELHGLLYGEISRFGAFQNFVHV